MHYGDNYQFLYQERIKFRRMYDRIYKTLKFQDTYYKFDLIDEYLTITSLL